ncbi:MAG: hypothetical protein LOD91_02375 [Limnochordales bacterium]|nr:hypothetical protein [Limnochordales bacterium]
MDDLRQALTDALAALPRDLARGIVTASRLCYNSGARRWPGMARRARFLLVPAGGMGE